MPKSGTTFVRTPESNQTRVNGLELRVQRQIIVDLESGALPDLNPATVIAFREALYGKDPCDQKLQRAVKDKIYYYRKLKSSDPAAYW